MSITLLEGQPGRRDRAAQICDGCALDAHAPARHDGTMERWNDEQDLSVEAGRVGTALRPLLH
jgi:hypothetical protein